MVKYFVYFLSFSLKKHVHAPVYDLYGLWSSAVLAHFTLNEKLQRMGVLGCVLCIIGSTIIILHAPEEETPSSVTQIWQLATQPGMPYYLDQKFLFLYVCKS